MKNLIIYNLLIISVLSAFLSSCTVITNGDVTAGQKPIVEAYLVAGQSITLGVKQEIPYGTSDTSNVSKPIDNLSISITNAETGQVFNLKWIGNGQYQSAAKEIVTVGSTYNLSFVYNGTPISASTIIPAKPQNFFEDKTSISRTQINLSAGVRPAGGFGTSEPVNLTWTNLTGDYYFIYVDNIEPAPTPIVILPSDVTTTTPVNRVFRNQPVTGSSDEIRGQSFQYFGRHNIILFKINPDYAALYKSEGTTSQNISTPPTSIVNGLGIFTGVNADTLAFTVLKN